MVHLSIRAFTVISMILLALFIYIPHNTDDTFQPGDLFSLHIEESVNLDTCNELNVENSVVHEVLNVDIEFEIIQMNIDGSTYDVIMICDGAYQNGGGGIDIPYVPVTIEVPGELIAIDVDLEDRIHVQADVLPSVIPGVIGMEESSLDPDFSRNEITDTDSGWSSEKISDHRKSSMVEEIHSVKIFPAEFSSAGDCHIYKRAVVRYSYRILPQVTFSSLDTKKPIGPIKYLIITHDDLADEAQVLADWKSMKGLTAHVETVSQIKDDYSGRNDQEKMRKFVMKMEKENDLEYLLLVGDWDKVKTANTRNEQPYTPYGEPSTFATDGYFACVDENTTWDRDGDGVLGESNDLDDPYPDMAVGRLAINSETILKEKIAELIEREKNINYTDEMGTAVFMAGDPSPNVGDACDTMDYFWEKYPSDDFDSRETMYWDGSGTMTFGSTSFSSVMNDRYQAIGYFSHGQYSSIPSLYGRSQVSSLNGDGVAGEFFTMACLTGWFDNPNQGSVPKSGDCFGEVMTETPNKGVAGYIGSSRLAVGDINRLYQGDAPGLEEDYWRAMSMAVNGDIDATVGSVYQEAVRHFVSSFYPFASYYTTRTYLEYNLLGDPDAPLVLREPQTLNLEFNVSSEKTYVTAMVTNGTGIPVQNALVSLYRRNEIGIAERTDVNGEVNITIPRSNGGIINITAFRTGDLYDNDTFILDDTLEPTGYHRIDPIRPNGNNGYYIRDPEIILSGDEPVDFEYFWDGDLPTFLEGPEITVTGFHGNHTLNYRVVDEAGHFSEWYSLNISVDTRPPDLYTSTYPPIPDGNNGWFITTPTVYLNATETIGPTTYMIGDKGLELDYEEGVLLGEGVFNLTFMTHDSNGVYNETNVTIMIDLSTPVSVLNTSIPPDGLNGYYLTPPDITLSGYDRRGSDVRYRWNDNNWTIWNEPIQPPHGTNLLTYQAVDSPGNMENTENFKWFKYDPNPPLVNMSIYPFSPDGSSGIYRTEPVINISAEDISSSDIYYKIDPVSNPIDWNDTSIPTLGSVKVYHGEWRVYIRVIDMAGNEVRLEIMEISVDIKKPSLDLNLSYDPDGTNGWFVSPVDLNVISISHDADIYYRLNNGTWTVLDNSFHLPEGMHDIEFIPRDNAGNEGTVITIIYKMDLTDPLAHINASSFSVFTGDPVEISGNGSFDGLSSIHYRFITSDGLTTQWTPDPHWNFMFFDPGNITIKLEVRDGSGRVGRSENVTIRILEAPAPVDDDENDSDPIDIYDPDPDLNITESDNGADLSVLFVVVIVLSMIVIIILIIFLWTRRNKYNDVDWEDEDDPDDIDDLDEIDIDDEPLDEDDSEFLFFE